MSKFDKDAFTYEDLIACAEGKLFGSGNAQLPMPPMLMFNKISKINNFHFSDCFLELSTRGNDW